MKKKQPRKAAPKVKTGLLVIGHGSRVPEAGRVLTQVIGSLRRDFRGFVVEFAFLEISKPDIQTGIQRCVAQGVSRILLVPYFLYLEGHVGRDIPHHMAEARARHPGLEIRIGPHLDFDRRIVAVVGDRIRTGLRAGRWT
jgi:sirohydrochlorin ferrochelatase